jgi:hypothetical protein
VPCTCFSLARVREVQKLRADATVDCALRADDLLAFARGQHVRGVASRGAAADPDDISGIQPPPQIGIEPMLAPIATPPRWDIDRIKAQIARLPGQSEVSCKKVGTVACRSR